MWRYDLKTHDSVPVLDDILEEWCTTLGNDFVAYKNHCYRVLNFSLALCGGRAEAMGKFSIAVAFHDLGIWVNNTYDYLGPSKRLAGEYLVKTKQERWKEEIETMIEQHHKLRRYKAHPAWLVEAFQKADWIDVSRGRLRFKLSPNFISEILTTFPNAGFHKRLVALTAQRAKTHPLSPLPMMRL